ncbi:MAG TPA: 16S rRNA (guanine(966)-N(2))-methyltransferase RsmD [Candidatus Omnitrophica bacterium]|nr:16S rRNA (guanine(966)-N(2))-methyltransferase RsmD [Candidatus Omnitrophota bacterium]
MKISKGYLKGKNIVSCPGIRPVSMRAKKACFDILEEELKDKWVLDLFAGSGGLGIEAISCGAKKAVFVEVKRRCIEMIRRNLISLRILPKAELYLKDVFSCIKKFFRENKKFEIIFVDPPYYKGMVRMTLQTLKEYDILAPYGWIVCFCYLKDDFFEKDDKFFLFSKRKFGQTLFLIYNKKDG